MFEIDPERMMNRNFVEANKGLLKAASKILFTNVLESVASVPEYVRGARETGGTEKRGGENWERGDGRKGPKFSVAISNDILFCSISSFLF